MICTRVWKWLIVGARMEQENFNVWKFIASLHADSCWAVLRHFVNNKIQETNTLFVH